MMRWVSEKLPENVRERLGFLRVPLIFIRVLFKGKIRDRVKFIKDIRLYKKLSNNENVKRFELKYEYLHPRLKDYRQKSGTVMKQYFIQDLVIARKIFESGIKEHIDIGSRVDGFVAHIASFLDKVTVLDIRPNIPKLFNIEFVQQDATNLSGISDNSIESISSLHAIEHFGLGRYGDPIDPIADIKAMKSLARVLKPGGALYFSVPIGRERVEYNGHRVYAPNSIVEQFESEGLKLQEFIALDTTDTLLCDLSPKDTIFESWNARRKYGCGIFTFIKTI